jgi:undecaprenyl-diphosphatase
MATPPDEARERVRQVLEQELEAVDSPEAAQAVLEEVERLAQGPSEQAAAQAAATAPAPAASVVEAAAAGAPPAAPTTVARVLTTAAAQAVAPTPEAAAVVAAAQQAVGTRPAPVDPRARRGARYLRAAILERLGPFQALDTRLFLAVNCLPHPRWLDRFADGVTFIATGGWIWVGGVLAARWLGVGRADRAFWQVLFGTPIATLVAEQPIKRIFRRRRPFIDIVRALVVGKKPGSWSFPSGHTASSFAAAWVLSTVWPRRAPWFLALAGAVGFSRVYVGAHYPGDVTTGALVGAVVAECVRRVVCRVQGRRLPRGQGKRGGR